jgi:hypothetical protein
MVMCALVLCQLHSHSLGRYNCIIWVLHVHFSVWKVRIVKRKVPNNNLAVFHQEYIAHDGRKVALRAPFTTATVMRRPRQNARDTIAGERFRDCFGDC